jgi:hypothetical protein
MMKNTLNQKKCALILIIIAVLNISSDKVDSDPFPEDHVVVKYNDKPLVYGQLKSALVVKGPVAVDIEFSLQERKKTYMNLVTMWLKETAINDYKKNNKITIPDEHIKTKQNEFLKSTFGSAQLTDEYIHQYNENIDQMLELAKLSFEKPERAEILYKEKYSSLMAEEEWDAVKSACKTQEGYLRFISYYTHIDKDTILSEYNKLAASVLEKEYIIQQLLEAGGFENEEELENSLLEKAVLDKEFVEFLSRK